MKPTKIALPTQSKIKTPLFSYSNHKPSTIMKPTKIAPTHALIAQ